jgi:hypothetical protein
MPPAAARPQPVPRARRAGLSCTALAVAIAFALSGCSGDATPTWDASVESHARAPARASFADASVPPEACAYDGSTLAFAETPRFSGGGGTDGERLVREIMRYTGLPQNFDVVPHREVPNAAALIVVDEAGTPRRVIAYNPAFMAQVARSTGDHNWAPISVMAHEIGHHLSGHTIRRGGSQPPIELEADQFSGFVLHKMGAGLADAQRALRALVPIEGGPTHPGRGQRLAAVERGWLEACRQLRDDCDGGAPDRTASRPAMVAAAAPTRPADDSSAPVATPVPEAAPARAAGTTAGNGVTAEPMTARAPDPGPDATMTIATIRPDRADPEPVDAKRADTRAAVDRLPVPDPAATPIKTTQFVWDELGLLDPETRAAHERAMFQHAERHGVEIVTLVVADLHGLDAEPYARAMARQLRVGKLDVGNGAVLVVAPRQRRAAAFLGPGLALEMQGHDKAAQLARWIEWNADGCLRRGACSAAETELLFGAADHLARQSAPWDWQVRYADFASVHAAAVREQASIESYDPATSAVYRRLARFEATVVALDPTPDDPDVLVHDTGLDAGRRAVRVDYGDGFRGVVYLDRATEALMPAGPLAAGRRYAMTGRVDALSRNPRDTQSFDVVSWDLAE